MQALTQPELDSFLAQNHSWHLDQGKLMRHFLFKDFVGAMSFVNLVATLAEEAGHHPDIDIRYNRVTLGLVTHDAGGITKRDTEMAVQLDRKFLE